MTTTEATADLCDRIGAAAFVADPIFRDFGGRSEFSGRIVSIRCFEDNSRVREVLGRPGEGSVLVVDGAGSGRCALLGDLLGELACQNGWEGVVVHGCVRDTRRLSELPLGVRALAAHPRKSEKRGIGEVDVPLAFAGVSWIPGRRLVADSDGIVLIAEQL